MTIIAVILVDCPGGMRNWMRSPRGDFHHINDFVITRIV